MPEPTLYLFDGYNLLHAGGHADVRELTDELASFVAMNGARGVVVFDGVGQEHELGPLSVRYAPHADTLLERLAAEHRHGERVCLVSSDAAVRGTSGQEVRKRLVGDVPARSREPDGTPRTRRHGFVTASIRRRAPGSSGFAAGSDAPSSGRTPGRPTAGGHQHEHMFLSQCKICKGVVSLARRC